MVTSLFALVASLIAFRQSNAAIYTSHSNNYFLDTFSFTNINTVNPCNRQQIATISNQQHLNEILSLCNTATNSFCSIDSNLVIQNGACAWQWTQGNDVCLANGNTNSFDCQPSNQRYAYPICSLPATSNLNSYLLILRLQDIQDGYFNITLKTTGVENENDINNNVYSIIGNLHPWFYRHNDATFRFKLIFSNQDGSYDELVWTQLSWLTDNVITGYEAINVADQTGVSSLDTFGGLAACNSPETYLDGNGNGNASNWWNAVGPNRAHNLGIPAFKNRIARSEALYIVQPQYELLSHLLNVDNGIFSSEVKTSGLENENNISANTFCRIGSFDYLNADYLDESGKYNFKLVYINTGSVAEIIWKQTSWLTQDLIAGFEAVRMSDQSAYLGTPREFKGLGLSSSAEAYLDGNAQEADWYNSIAPNTLWDDHIPGYAADFDKNTSAYFLYIYSFHVMTDGPTTLPTALPTAFPTLNPTNTPSSTPTKNPTNAPTTKAPTTYAPTTGELGITDKPSKSPSNVTDAALSFESISFNEMITNDTILIVMILIFIVGALLGGIIALVACMCWKKKAKRKDTQLNMAEMVKMDSVQSAGNTTNVNAEIKMNVNVIAAPFANIVNGMVEDEMKAHSSSNESDSDNAMYSDEPANVGTNIGTPL